MPKPAEMLLDEHIKPMLDECRHARDRRSCRCVGLRSPQRGNPQPDCWDVSDHLYGLRISVDGKKGERSVILTTAVPQLQRG